MKAHIQNLIHEAVNALKQQKILAEDIIPTIQIERTRDKIHGDYACNIAMMLAKATSKKPRELAEIIVQNIQASELVQTITIAGPGFINFTLKSNAINSIIEEILTAEDQFGLTNIGQGKRINIEFVSSNPTGPLHVGHGRGAAFGATIADLFEAIGYQVDREYYVNDAGRQMDILAVSIWLRYLQLYQANFNFPRNAYKGEYVIDLANELKSKYQKQFIKAIETVYENVPEDETESGHGDKEAHIDALIKNAKLLLKDDYQLIFNFGLNEILEGIKSDLAGFGVTFQNWFSEKRLKDQDAISHAIENLKQHDLIYERKGATWFNSSSFGDDKDRVLVRENGQSTYFASDAAYLLNKFERNYSKIIYVFGADHHGYVPRLRAAANAFNIPQDLLIIPLVQFAILYRGAERVQMSTRSGSFVTLRELYEEVGKDAARFFYVMRKNEQHMDFDLELAKSQSSDNPVYYIQYAHARICSVFRQLAEKDLSFDRQVGLKSLDLLLESHEQALLMNLSRYQEIVINAATKIEPHTLATYLRELAHDLHTYYNAHQFIVDDVKLRNARLCLVLATKQVLKNGLRLLGVSAPTQM